MKAMYAALTICFLFTVSYSPVFAENSSYIRGHIGAAFLEDSDLSYSSNKATVEYDPGVTVGGAIGYDFGMPRVELEMAYYYNDADNVTPTSSKLYAINEITALNFMVNGYIDVETQTALTPYVYAGIGLALLDTNDFVITGVQFGNDDDSVFAWQLGAGIGYSITKTIEIDLCYRYFKTDDPEFDGVKSEYGGNAVFAGIRYYVK
ncbi:MAG: outer membrane beta-barrel protein [Desulfobacterales bacterium]|nr:outer membrane beta-barrel protein [Desulfobacterales bacterium]MDD4071555.1 outer membrane beta-barrel protein [Desulfobacterales bacterium]MDD4391544.1 outer membrane beta-barrel protein [Desulfobacterales bacterium]